MTGHTSPFPIRGVIEGFYGTFYTVPERNDLIRFLGKHDFNLYLYGPKNDRLHRARWREPYPASVLEDFATTIRVARHAGVSFCYAISFGVPIDFSSAHDFDSVIAKFQAFFERGCRCFGIFFDDSPTYFTHGANQDRFRSPAHAHADFSNRVFAWLLQRDRSISCYVAPVDYHGRRPSPYLRELSRELHPNIRILYTGPDICSSAITLADMVTFKGATGREPVIWDNYPVNDLGMRRHLHIGPLLGRDSSLADGCAGYLANLMNQEEASKIPLLTAAEYLRDPDHYQPMDAWERALRNVGGESYEALRRFAENSLRSCLAKEEAPTMDRLTGDVLNGLREGAPVEGSGAVVALEEYLDAVDEAIYHLRNRMRNLALRQELIPWIDALDEKVWLGRFALEALCALERHEDTSPVRKRLKELMGDVRRNPKRIGGSAISELGKYAFTRVREEQRRMRAVEAAG